MSTQKNTQSQNSLNCAARCIARFTIGTLLSFSLLIVHSGAQTPNKQLSFATPDQAASAVYDAFKTNDLDKLATIFGPVGAFASGDAVADKEDREVIALAMNENWRWVSRGSKKQLVIGDEAWPFPVPLMKVGSSWQFDSVAGQEEILARRVGRNELAVIELCGTYVDVQREYAALPHDGKKAGVYAERVQSTPGKQDGLYWAAKPGEAPSPMGDLFAEAAAGGYERAKDPSAPYQGYYFRILTAQGASAPGGVKDYIVGDDMTGGFALLAYPAKYAFSGVMTFVVNQDGIVYEQDLGKDTAKIANQLKSYNPDKSWRKVRAN